MSGSRRYTPDIFWSAKKNCITTYGRTDSERDTDKTEACIKGISLTLNEFAKRGLMKGTRR